MRKFCDVSLPVASRSALFLADIHRPLDKICRPYSRRLARHLSHGLRMIFYPSLPGYGCTTAGCLPSPSFFRSPTCEGDPGATAYQRRHQGKFCVQGKSCDGDDYGLQKVSCGLFANAESTENLTKQIVRCEFTGNGIKRFLCQTQLFRQQLGLTQQIT